MDEERDLVNRAIDGSEEAIEALVRRYQRMVYAFAYRMINDMEEAKDVTQNIFIKAVNGLKDFRRESSFRTWLYRIAVNVCLNHRRSQRGNETELVETLRDGRRDALSIVIERERERLIRDALNGLPPKQRLAIVLRAYEGLSSREAAAVMGCSEGAVKAHYHLGIKRLREILDKKEKGNGIQS
jgi:RNA polymerase sigma-70 factor (ECF subfamily)